VAAAIGVDEKLLGGWLHAIGYIRNLCAHHSRLWNRTLAIRPRCPKKWPYGKIDNSRLYLSLMVLYFVISKIAPGSDWKLRLRQLVDASPVIDTSAMGFPSNWRDKEPWHTT
jgi:abortive infection bacteriophage resistance protein